LRFSRILRLPHPASILDRFFPIARNCAGPIHQPRVPWLALTGTVISIKQAPAFLKGKAFKGFPASITLAAIPKCGSCPTQSTQDSDGRSRNNDSNRSGGASGNNSSTNCTADGMCKEGLHLQPFQSRSHLSHSFRPSLSQPAIRIRPVPFITLDRNPMPKQEAIHHLVTFREQPRRRARPSRILLQSIGEYAV